MRRRANRRQGHLTAKTLAVMAAASAGSAESRMQGMSQLSMPRPAVRSVSERHRRLRPSPDSPPTPAIRRRPRRARAHPRGEVLACRRPPAGPAGRRSPAVAACLRTDALSSRVRSVGSHRLASRISATEGRSTNATVSAPASSGHGAFGAPAAPHPPAHRLDHRPLACRRRQAVDAASCGHTAATAAAWLGSSTPGNPHRPAASNGNSR